MGIIQRWWAVAVSALAVVLGVVVKFLSVRNKALEKENDRQEAWLDRQEDTREKDAEIDLKFDGLQADAKEALENDEIPDHLRNPDI